MLSVCVGYTLITTGTKKGGRSRKLLKLRHTLLEGLFGQAKSYHGLGRARWRGLANMLIQSLVIATVLNLKKLLIYSSRTVVAAATVYAKSVFDRILQICDLCLSILGLCSVTGSKMSFETNSISFQR